MSYYEQIKIGLEIVLFLISGGAAVYASLVAKNAASEQKVSALESKLTDDIGDLRADISRLDERSKRSPTHDDLTRVHERIDAMEKALHTMIGEFSGMRHTVNLIHDYLMQAKK